MGSRKKPVGYRRSHVEMLEDRRLLKAATFAELSAPLGLDGLQGGSGQVHAGGILWKWEFDD